MTAAYVDAATRRRSVLVAIMNNPDDLCRATSEGWYRIPQRRAPRRIGADFLAFYQTGKFKGAPEAQTVTFYAPTRRYRLLTRRELMPAEADHPRADDFYFRIDIGPLQRLERPVPATTLKRIAFIHTTFERLLTADDVRDLFPVHDPFEQLWLALREHRLRPLPNRIVGERPVDIALRARSGALGIRCTDNSHAQETGVEFGRTRWEMLNLSTLELEEDLAGCLRRIGAALLALGGSTL